MATKQQSSTIHVSLTSTLADYVQEQVDSGLYGNSSEVVREALREKYQKNISETKKIQELKKAVGIGLKQLEAEEFNDDTLEDILKRIK